MQITIEIPDDIAEYLTEQVGNLPRHTLEAFAIEGYRGEHLSHGQVGRILGLSWWEVEMLLSEAKAYLHYDEDDLARDRETMRRLRMTA